METLMPTTNPTRSRISQLALFCEPVPLPQWRNLPEPLRAEVIRNLARLLRSVHAGGLNGRSSVVPDRGERDE